MGTRTRRCAIAIVAMLAWAGVVRANSGTQIPISQMQTNETAFMVPNGTFESVTAGDADGWTEIPAGSMQAAAPVNTQGKPWFGNSAAQSTVANGRYQMSIAVSENTAYTLSGYIWNIGQAGAGAFDDDLALIELRTGPGGTLVKNVALERQASDGGDAANGYFLYDTFTTAAGQTSLNLEVIFDDAVAGGTLPAVTAQFDNIGVTPSNSFVAPTVPEPAGLTLLALGALGMLRRRRA